MYEAEFSQGLTEAISHSSGSKRQLKIYHRSHDDGPSGTFKDHKAGIAVDVAINERGADAACVISAGSYANALIAAAYGRDLQTIELVHRPQRALPYCNVEPVFADLPEGPQRVQIGLDYTHKTYSSPELEAIVQQIARGALTRGNRFSRKVKQFFGRPSTSLDRTLDVDDPTYDKLRKLQSESGLDFSHVADVTNGADFAPGKALYGTLAKTYRHTDADLIIVPGGSCEYAAEILEASNTGLFRKRPDVMIVVPQGHPLDPVHGYQRSDAEKATTPVTNSIHKSILNGEYSNALVFTVPETMIKSNRDAFVNDVNSDFVDSPECEVRAEPTAALGYAPLRAGRWTSQGFVIPNVYRFQRSNINVTPISHAQQSRDAYTISKKGLFKRKGDPKVIIENTGHSSLHKLREKVAGDQAMRYPSFRKVGGQWVRRHAA